MKLLLIAATLLASSAILAAEERPAFRLAQIDTPRPAYQDNILPLPTFAAPPTPAPLPAEVNRLEQSMAKIENILYAAGAIIAGLVAVLARLQGVLGVTVKRVDTHGQRINDVALAAPPPAPAPPPPSLPLGPFDKA